MTPAVAPPAREPVPGGSVPRAVSAASERVDRNRAQRAASRMPDWMGSIRFRLAVVYSSVLFGLAAVMLSVVYIGLALQLKDATRYQVIRPQPIVVSTPSGPAQLATIDEFRNFEEEVNAATLGQLRRYSFAALFVLFLASLVIGWFVAGSALAPVEQITLVAREIQATDLKRRIDLGGPPDELKDLADTFDDMLDRIDGAFEDQREFIHEASHELRNPLAVIRTNVDVTLADPDASTDELRETLAVVQRSSERMTRLVDDLLTHARQGERVPVYVPVDLSSLVEDVAGEFRVVAASRGLALQIDAAPTVPVQGDPVALRQALANLLANAVRLAPEHTALTVTAGRDQGWAWMAVADEGPGIAPDDQSRVFQRFYRGDAPGAPGSRRQSSGLGLTIVRQIAEAHRGEVKLVSELGVGSTFAVWIPLAADRSPAEHPSDEPVPAPAVVIAPSETTVTDAHPMPSPRL